MTDLHLPDPEEIPKEDAPAVLTQVSAFSMAIAARMLTDTGEEQPKEEDELLTADQAAELLAVKPDWLYRRVKNLPFVRRLSRKALRFSRRGLLAWRDKRKG
jgi:predicted DNA-binding transcriptional regulator AlpA